MSTTFMFFAGAMLVSMFGAFVAWLSLAPCQRKGHVIELPGEGEPFCIQCGKWRHEIRGK